MRRLTFEQLVAGEVNITSIINEVDFVVGEQSAISIAQRRWRCEPQLIDGDKHERRLQ